MLKVTHLMQILLWFLSLYRSFDLEILDRSGAAVNYGGR